MIVRKLFPAVAVVAICLATLVTTDALPAAAWWPPTAVSSPTAALRFSAP